MFQGLIDFLIFLLLSAYYIIEGIITSLLPRSYRAGWRESLKGDIVLVTGGGNGIGKLICQKFSKLGATVVIWDINSQGADDTAAMLKKDGGKVFSYKCDISKCEDVYATANKVREEVGKVTILVNNAGIVSGKRLLDTPDHMVKKTFDVNILAHFWTTKAFLPDMITEDNGHVVTIASLAGLVGVNKLVDYSASKFAAVGFDEALRLELEVEGRRGVHTTVVCPYYVNTGMFEGVKSRLFPILEPEYVADEIVTAVRSRDKVLLIPGYLRCFLALKFLVPWDCSLVFLRCLIADTMKQFGYQIPTPAVPTKLVPISKCDEITSENTLLNGNHNGIVNGNNNGNLNGNGYHRLHSEDLNNGRKP